MLISVKNVLVCGRSNMRKARKTKHFSDNLSWKVESKAPGVQPERERGRKRRNTDQRWKDKQKLTQKTDSMTSQNKGRWVVKSGKKEHKKRRKTHQTCQGGESERQNLCAHTQTSTQSKCKGNCMDGWVARGANRENGHKNSFKILF